MPRQQQPKLQHIIEQRFSRRKFINIGLTGTAALTLGSCISNANTPHQHSEAHHNTEAHQAAQTSTLSFHELSQEITPYLEVPDQYQYQVLLRWGDPIFSNAPSFDPNQLSASAQEKQFGFNNDFVGFLPLPLGSKNSDKGLLVVNHEYTDASMMFAHAPKAIELNEQQTAIDIAAHGMSVIEIERRNNQWGINLDSPYNRRITPHSKLTFTGPAAGSHRLKTALSDDGIKSYGTYSNCAGGVTPWGTVLSGEENIDYVFAGDFSQSDEVETHKRFGMRSKLRKSWAKYHDRWDMSKQPNEPLHAGWIVEIDPYDPNSTPKKRSALGRFKHEGCNLYITKDQQVVAYTGDDQAFEYLYKFVSDKRYDPNDRQANLTLLDEGTLFCARFYDDGRLEWLPLTYGKGKLTEANGFFNQGDVMIDTRKAADLLGATPMDRPEDVEVNPHSGQVYVMLTNNQQRTEQQVDAVNPRAFNAAGQILELIAPNDDHSATMFHWEMLLIAGKPDKHTLTQYHPDITERGWLACPDNCAFDHRGNLWIGTDGAQSFDIADGLWATELSGHNRALTKRFLKVPIGAELCGPYFTPDNKHLFCAIQHPGSGSNYHNPSTRWPDFKQGLPPRPSVVVVSHKNAKVIGSE